MASAGFTPPVAQVAVAVCANAAAVVPSDATVFATPTRRLYVGTAGNVTVTMAGVGGSILFSNVPVGFFDICCTQVKATGTAAGNIVALW